MDDDKASSHNGADKSDKEDGRSESGRSGSAGPGSGGVGRWWRRQQRSSSGRGGGGGGTDVEADSAMPTSQSESSDGDSDAHTTVVSMSRRWTTLETIGRCMFLFSVAFFIIGVLITVFGFSNAGIAPAQQLPLRVLGLICLFMTFVMWGVGCIFSRLWNREWKRQQQALELRDRVQLHALAMDILNSPVISPTMLQDPRLRRQLLLKLRQQRALDISSQEGASRRSSRAVSMEKRRASAISGHTDTDRRKSRDTAIIGDDKRQFELPGIQISRIETLDLSDGASVISGSVKGSKRYIIIHSDVSSDFSRLSCPSDYSLAGSRSSKSRSSRASSGVSSRLWDFSPRESEWDADISLGSRESQLNVSKQDWGGGPADFGSNESTTSPTMPRKMSVVTFDMSEPFRRHSSPAYSIRRKDGTVGNGAGGAPGEGDCSCAPAEPFPSALKHRDMSCQVLRADDSRRGSNVSSLRKTSGTSFRSLRIDEDDGDDDDEDDDEKTPLRIVEIAEGGAGVSIRPSLKRNMTEPIALRVVGEVIDDCRIPAERLRPPLRRNNTDDSEVERRVARLFKEIEFSVSDSVDESRINSQEYDCMPSLRRAEAQTQTVTEEELLAAAVHAAAAQPTAASRRDAYGEPRASYENVATDIQHLNIQYPTAKPKEKRSKLAVIGSALASLGRRASPEPKSKSRRSRQTALPRLLQGLSDDRDHPQPPQGDTNPHRSSSSSPHPSLSPRPPSSPRISRPPTYEDVVNKNL